jgi:hypothetical protein
VNTNYAQVGTATGSAAWLAEHNAGSTLARQVLISTYELHSLNKEIAHTAVDVWKKQLLMPLSRAQQRMLWMVR